MINGDIRFLPTNDDMKDVTFSASSRRQQLMPEPQPISSGRYSQGMPVFSTNRMPLRACRWLIGLRPGYRRRLGLEQAQR
jgi:hypothetical protein